MTFPSRLRAGARGVWLPQSLTPRGFPVDPAAAPPLPCSRLREVPGLPGGRRPLELSPRVGGGRPHTRCPELVPQVPRQAGQRPMPRCLCVPLRSAGRHSALTADLPPLPGSPIFVGVGVRCGGFAFLPRQPWAPRAAVGSAVQAIWLHDSSVAVSLARGLPPLAAAWVGSPDPRAVGRPPGRRCVPDPGRGPGRGLGGRETTAMPAAPAGQSVGCGAAEAPVCRASWPVGSPCWTLPEPGGARCRRAGRQWCRSR